VRRRWPFVAVLALTLGAGAWAWQRTRAASDAPAWRTAPVTRRDVQRIVTATGPIAADPTVEVGTQVSGIVSEVLVDFNARVRRGQVLARIDTSLLQADVDAARARVAEAHAVRERRAVEATRIDGLHARQSATDQERIAARADLAVAEAQVRAASVTLRRARRNLAFATISAPIDGVVVRRAVDPGQTVNAGFSAPTLFKLAGSLARMTILTDVDEADVGLLREGQPARFTVQTFPDRTFVGTVRQVRIDAKVQDNVVTYTTVVEVPNPDGVLLPGMTATVEFVVAEAKGVLCAPNAALRFRPEGAPPATTPTVWTPAGDTPRPVPVTTGLRGAECTEVRGDGVSADMPVILGTELREPGRGGNPLSGARPRTHG
jgi:HlyD family secretion protein